MNEEMAMASGTSGEHRLRDGAITFAIAIGYEAMLVWFNGGRPRTTWFYPYALVIAVGLGLVVFVRGRPRRQWPKGEVGPVQPIRVAITWGMVRGLATGATAGILLWLGFWERSLPFLCAMLAVMTALSEYRYRRGLTYSGWPMAIAVASVLFVEILLVDVFKVVARG